MVVKKNISSILKQIFQLGFSSISLYKKKKESTASDPYPSTCLPFPHPSLPPSRPTPKVPEHKASSEIRTKCKREGGKIGMRQKKVYFLFFFFLKGDKKKRIHSLNDMCECRSHWWVLGSFAIPKTKQQKVPAAVQGQTSINK